MTELCTGGYSYGKLEELNFLTVAPEIRYYCMSPVAWEWKECVGPFEVERDTRVTEVANKCISGNTS